MSDAAPSATRPAGGWRRWLIPGVLLVSLAFNVFLGSALVGRFAHDQARGDPGMFAGFRGFTEGLPAPARDTVRDSFRARRTEIGRERREMREARQRVAEALAAEPFDAAAARRAFDGLRRTNDEIARVAQDALVEAAAKLPAEMRRELRDRRPRSQRPPPGEGPPPAARP